MKVETYKCDKCGKSASPRIKIVTSLSVPRQIAEDDGSEQVNTDLCPSCAEYFLERFVSKMSDDERCEFITLINKNLPARHKHPSAAEIQ